MYKIIEIRPAYCVSTDRLIGAHRRLVDERADLEEALDRAEALDHECDDDEVFHVVRNAQGRRVCRACAPDADVPY